MASYSCTVCGTRSDRSRCPRHRPSYRQRRGISSGSKAQKINAAVLRRDGYRCTHVEDGVRCTETEDLHVDHRIPVIRGGTWEMDNLQTLCADHNLRKGATVG